jgi:hypothetical protein
VVVEWQLSGVYVGGCRYAGSSRDGVNSTTDADDALVISTGDWLDMRKFLKTYQNAEQTHLTQSVQAVALHLN